MPETTATGLPPAAPNVCASCGGAVYLEAGELRDVGYQRPHECRQTFLDPRPMGADPRSGSITPSEPDRDEPPAWGDTIRRPIPDALADPATRARIIAAHDDRDHALSDGLEEERRARARVFGAASERLWDDPPAVRPLGAIARAVLGADRAVTPAITMEEAQRLVDAMDVFAPGTDADLTRPRVQEGPQRMRAAREGSSTGGGAGGPQEPSEGRREGIPARMAREEVAKVARIWARTLHGTPEERYLEALACAMESGPLPDMDGFAGEGLAAAGILQETAERMAELETVDEGFSGLVLGCSDTSAPYAQLLILRAALGGEELPTAANERSRWLSVAAMALTRVEALDGQRYTLAEGTDRAA